MGKWKSEGRGDGEKSGNGKEGLQGEKKERREWENAMVMTNMESRPRIVACLIMDRTDGR